MTDPFARLKELCRDLPTDLVADWQNTNHYELTSAHESNYFWLCVDDDASFLSSTTEGTRLGLLLDIAAELSRLKQDGVL